MVHWIHGYVFDVAIRKKRDVIVLQNSYDNDSFIISNDKFRCYNDIFEGAWIERSIMSFVFINDNIYLDILIKLKK